MIRHVLGAFALAGASASCAPLVGGFHGDEWELSPNRCASGAHLGYVGADLFRAAQGDDTEVVVRSDGPGYAVLVRVPGQGRMVVLRPADCEVFRADLHDNGVETRGVKGIAGSVQLDCRRPEIGHVTGAAVFSCD